MPAEFITMDDKMKIHKSITDPEIRTFVICELQRLESIIRDYEIPLQAAHDRFIGKSFNNPKQLNP